MNLIQLESGSPARTIELSSLPLVIGRQPARGASVVHPTISREHARLFAREGGIAVADLNSSNGTFVNGERVTRADLKHGDVLRLGQVEFRVDLGLGEVDRPAAGTTTAESNRPADSELFGDDDGGIRLEEDHLKLDVHGGGARAPGGATSTFIGSPAALAGGIAPPPPKSVYAEALRRPVDPKRAGNLLTADVEQQSAIRRFITFAVVLAIAAGLFWGAMRLIESMPDDAGFGDDDATKSEPDEGG